MKELRYFYIFVYLLFIFMFVDSQRWRYVDPQIETAAFGAASVMWEGLLWIIGEGKWQGENK